MHDPLCTCPFRIFGVFNVTDLAIVAEDLQTHPCQALRCRIILPRVEKPLNIPACNLLDDDMLLGFHAGVAFDLIVNNIAVRRIRPRHHMFIKEDGSNTHEKPKQDGRSGNTHKADAAGLHRRNLTRGRKTAKCEKAREQHGHGERPHDDPWQAEHEDLNDRGKRRPIIRNIFCNAKESPRADKNS